MRTSNESERDALMGSFLPVVDDHVAPDSSKPPPPYSPFSRRRSRFWKRSCSRAVVYTCVVVTLLLIAPSIFLAIFCPVYTKLPAHYTELYNRINNSTALGRGNISGKRIFIAANIVDAKLIRGAWGDSVKELVKLLGPEHVFISIYENDSGQDTKAALAELAGDLACNKSIVGGAHLDLATMTTTPLPGGGSGVKRIEYLAEVRNRALRPLDDDFENESGVGETDPGFVRAEGTFDRILFLNDVYFDAVDAVQLLFSTNVKDDKGAQYEAACAADFMSITNYYDDFATRDFEGFTLGYGPGFRIFPWFSRAGDSRSRRDTLSGQDAVAVRSCWGGMVAFNSKWFQQSQPEEGSKAGPVRFRSEVEPYWDASECCLVHADISQRFLAANPDATDHGIYLNPYIRVAYRPRTFRWLMLLARFEHGFVVLQDILTIAAGYPMSSERRLEVASQMSERREYVFHPRPDVASDQPEGEYKKVVQPATPGGFCGVRGMAIMRPDYRDAHARGEQYFVNYAAPSK